MFFATFATAVLGVTGALAAPAVSTNVNPADHDDISIPTSIDLVDADYANCSLGVAMLSNGGAARSYSIHIGRDYGEGSGCEPIRNTISKAAAEGDFTFYEQGFYCIDDGNGNTFITFYAGGVFDYEDNNDIIDALQTAYPMIPFVNHGICSLDAKRLMARTDPIEHNGASCSTRTLEDHNTGTTDEYSVHVGRPFINGAGCEPIHKTLNDMVDFGVTKYSCKDDGYGNTQLVFVVHNALMVYQEVNEAMQTAYPDVSFRANHICEIH